MCWCKHFPLKRECYIFGLPQKCYRTVYSLENPNPNNKCVTQLGIPITITSIDNPLILVKYKSNTREASWVTLGVFQRERQGDRITPLYVKV
jgi:hypothetical protein